MKIYIRNCSIDRDQRPFHSYYEDIERVSIWVSDEVYAPLPDAEPENLLTVVAWFPEGKTKTFTRVIDCEVF